MSERVVHIRFIPIGLDRFKFIFENICAFAMRALEQEKKKRVRENEGQRRARFVIILAVGERTAVCAGAYISLAYTICVCVTLHWRIDYFFFVAVIFFSSSLHYIA